MAAMRPEVGTPAREKVLFHLKTRGPQSAAVIARRLGVTAMAVRQHLYKLAEELLVQFEDERRGPGRPLRVWRLTPKADDRFPDAHADLTVELLSTLRSAFGEEGLDKLIAERTRQQEREYRKRMPDGAASLRERVAALTRIRREEGYLAEFSRKRDGSFLLVENHCPICAAANACQGLCREELTLFRTLLGKAVQVERVDHILAGARRCAYRIQGRE